MGLPCSRDDADAWETDDIADHRGQPLAGDGVQALHDVRHFEDDELRNDRDEVSVFGVLEKGSRCGELRVVACRQVRDKDVCIDDDVRTSDAPSSLPRFLHCLDGVVGAALHGTFPTPQAWPLGRDGDTASAYFPRQLGAGLRSSASRTSFGTVV